MGGVYGGFFKGDKKKKKKEILEKKAQEINRVYAVPQVEIIKKGKKSY